MDLNLLMEIVLLWEQKKKLKTLYFFVMIDYPCAEHHNHRVFIRKGKNTKGHPGERSCIRKGLQVMSPWNDQKWGKILPLGQKS